MLELRPDTTVWGAHRRVTDSLREASLRSCRPGMMNWDPAATSAAKSLAGACPSACTKSQKPRLASCSASSAAAHRVSGDVQRCPAAATSAVASANLPHQPGQGFMDDSQSDHQQGK